MDLKWQVPSDLKIISCGRAASTDEYPASLQARLRDCGRRRHVPTISFSETWRRRFRSGAKRPQLKRTATAVRPRNARIGFDKRVELARVQLDDQLFVDDR